MSRILALAAVVFLAAPVSADDKDWTGKTVKLTADVKLGSKLGGGLVRDGAALDKGKTFVVKSDDGSYLELVGQTGYVFKSEAEVVAGREMPRKGDPAPKADEKDLWAIGTKVLPKKRTSQIQFGDRDEDGKQTFFKMSGRMPMHVHRDNGDGWVRIHDGKREGWVSKEDLVTKEDAPIYFDKAVKANPENVWVLYMRGLGWRQKGEPDNAIKDFTECIRLDPTYYAAYDARGNAWGAKNEYDKAIEDYTESIRLKPENPTAYSNRGTARANKKEHDKAIEDYTESIRLEPSATPFNNRGNAWRDKKEYEKAIKDYDAALKIDPLHHYAVGNKAHVQARLKKCDDAVKGFEAAITLNQDGWALCQYASFLASCPDAKYRDGRKAVELAKKAIEKAGKNADWEYFAALAAAYAETGDFERAVAEQRKALEDKSLDTDNRKKAEARLELYKAKKPYRDEE